MGEPLGIMFSAIEFIFNLYEIDDIEEQRSIFEKIQAIETVKMRFRSNELIKQKNSKKPVSK